MNYEQGIHMNKAYAPYIGYLMSPHNNAMG